jgi:hypothetical protein
MWRKAGQYFAVGSENVNVDKEDVANQFVDGANMVHNYSHLAGTWVAKVNNSVGQKAVICFAKEMLATLGKPLSNYRRDCGNYRF